MQLAGLKAEWAAYRKLLSEVGNRLQKAKADFKDDLISSLNAFNDQVTGMRTDFLRNAPFAAGVEPARARELIAEYRASLARCARARARWQAGCRSSPSTRPRTARPPRRRRSSRCSSRPAAPPEPEPDPEP